MSDTVPKRPVSAFILWLNENRENIKEQFPGSDGRLIAHYGSKLWKDVEDKTKWEQMSAKMREEYRIAKRKNLDLISISVTKIKKMKANGKT